MPEFELPEPAGTPRREQPIVWMVAASLALHLGVLGFLLWRALRTALEAMPPAAIEVELVTLSEEASSEPQPSSAASGPASSEPPAAEEPSSVEPPPSQAEPSEAPSSAVEPPPSEPATATLPAPTPMPRPITVTVGSGEEPSAQPTSAEESGVTELTAETGDEAAGDAEAAAPAMGELNVAQTFYLADILGSASMANARETLENLPRDKRLSQTCNIEAVGQVGNMGRGFTPDAVIAEAFSPAVISGTRLVVNGAIFRSARKWHALAFDCTLNDDLTAVTAFTFRLGPDVTAVVERAQQSGG